MGHEEQVDQPVAGIPARLIARQHRPSFSIFGPGKQIVAADRVVQGLWFAAQRMDDMMVVDDMNPMPIIPPACPRMTLEIGGLKIAVPGGFDPVHLTRVAEVR